MKKPLILLFFALISLFWSCKPKESGKVEFVILQLNDVYEIAPVEGGKRGGISRVATIRKNLLEKTPNVITILSGDFLSPSLTGSLKQDGVKIAGAQMVEALNVLGLDYVTFGNHEFDLKEDDFQRKLDMTEFAWTSCNVLHHTEAGNVPFEKNGVPLPEYIIHTVKDPSGKEVKVGFIGTTLPFNKQPYVHYEDKFAEFERVNNEIKDQCDIVIGITHLFSHQDDSLAQRVQNVPMLVGGHDHMNMALKSGATTTYKADANAKSVYAHFVTIDLQTKKSTIWSQLIPVTLEFQPDPEVDAVVQKWVEITDASIVQMGYDASEVVGNASEPLDGKESSIRDHQTNLGSLIAKSLLDADPKAKAAFLNGGTIRVDDEMQGQITQYDILRTLPFGGAITHAKFPGDVLKKILNTGEVTNKGEGGYLQRENLTQNEAGEWLIGTEVIQDNKSYDLVIPSFLSEGRESNLEFMNNPAWYTELQLTGVKGDNKNDIRDVVINYMKKSR
ncbi:MAG: bifunctional metallophosphatase/5'-nucleotidase [Bacteroidia bacterium]|nr:bifunctional metallophosphatase/5'-nucleotidase [Bacteroidia bacterium]